jgi:hypothetical protein
VRVRSPSLSLCEYTPIHDHVMSCHVRRRRLLLLEPGRSCSALHHAPAQASANQHRHGQGRSATGRAAVPALPPPWTRYPRFCAASRWGATAGLSHGRQCRASRSRRAAPAVGVDCETHHPRSILLEGGWSTPEPAGRAVWAARGRQRRYPPASTSHSLGHRNFPSDPERITPQATRRPGGISQRSTHQIQNTAGRIHM